MSSVSHSEAFKVNLWNEQNDMQDNFVDIWGYVNAGGPVCVGNTLTLQWCAEICTLIVTKNCAGFDRKSVSNLQKILQATAEGKTQSLKYLVFDFAHQGEATETVAEGFEDLVASTAELILEAPVITVTWARGRMACADLEFAMHCSFIVAEKQAMFSFDGDPSVFFRLYASVARRLGFVRAERLIENRQLLAAEDMRELSLVRDVVEQQTGLAGIMQFMVKSSRRYNAAYAVFRAQCLAMPAVERRYSASSPY